MTREEKNEMHCSFLSHGDNYGTRNFNIASAKIVSTAVDYKQGGDNLQGWIVYDDAIAVARAPRRSSSSP